MNHELLELAALARKTFNTPPPLPQTVKKPIKKNCIRHYTLDTLPEIGSERDGTVFVGRNIRRRKNETYWTEIRVPKEEWDAERKRVEENYAKRTHNRLTFQIAKALAELPMNGRIEIPKDDHIKTWRTIASKYNKKNPTQYVRISKTAGAVKVGNPRTH